jgi:acetolactate synthase-1/3 small subunit
VVPGTDQSIAALLKQMLKLVSVIEATDISAIPFVQRELMMVKVLADMQGRSSVLQVAEIFRAKVPLPQASFTVWSNMDPGYGCPLDKMRRFR